MKGSVRDSTLHMQLTTMAMLANQIGWDRDLRRITSKDIEAYRSKRLEDGIETATANKEVKLLRRLFQLAIIRRYLTANPCNGVALTKVGRKRVPYCSPESVHAIFAQVADALRQAMLVVFYQTGIRLPLLVGLAGAIGTTRRIRLKFDWCEWSIIWAIIVARSGQRKSPPFKAAIRPLDEMQADAMKEQAQALLGFKADMLEFTKEYAAYKSGKIDTAPDQPERPVCKRYITTDTTVEALAPKLLENPRGLALVRDELSGWFAGFNQYKAGGKGADAAHWLGCSTLPPATPPPRDCLPARAAEKSRRENGSPRRSTSCRCPTPPQLTHQPAGPAPFPDPPA